MVEPRFVGRSAPGSVREVGVRLCIELRRQRRTLPPSHRGLADCLDHFTWASFLRRDLGRNSVSPVELLTKTLNTRHSFSFIENMEYSFHALRQLAHPEKALVLVHLAEHEGDTPEELSDHLERPLSSIYRYLADLEPSGLVHVKEKDGVRHYHPVAFHVVLTSGTLEQMLGTPVDLAALYRASLGKRRWERVAKAADRARRGETTLRQLAVRSGLPYREFISLYQALGSSRAPAKDPVGG